MDIFDETLWSIEVDAFVAADQEPQKAIEAEEMIDMSMRNEDALHAFDVSRR